METCTTCEKNPPLGVGAGKMKETCLDCIGQYVTDGVCPACRGVGLGADKEHVAACNGKLPKFVLDEARAAKKAAKEAEKAEAARQREERKTLAFAQREAKAQARAEERRRKGRKGDVETAKQRIDRLERMKAEAKAAKEKSNNGWKAEDASPVENIEQTEEVSG